VRGPLGSEAANRPAQVSISAIMSQIAGRSKTKRLPSVITMLHRAV